MFVSAAKLFINPYVGLLLVLAASLFRTGASVQVDISPLDDGPSISQHSALNIAFDLPDLTATVDTTSGEVQLEAFRSISNDRILADATGKRSSRLFWVSIGHPNFVKSQDPKSGKDFKLFHVSDRGFNCYIEMMTRSQRQILASTAKSKYQVNVTERQVVNLILSSFQCTLPLYDDNGNKYLLNGKVTDFRHFPLRMDFLAPQKTMERKLFLEFISGSGTDLQFDCNLESSGGKLMRINTLAISAEQQQQIGLEEKLFGPAGNNGSNEVYVTRDQMTELSSEMYSTLNIVEDYQMPEHEFSEAFVNDLISMLASRQFAPVPIDDVLKNLSKYGFDIGADIQPDVIKRDAGSILKIQSSNSKNRIVVDETKYRDFANSQSPSNRRRFGVLAFRRSANWARANSDKSVSDGRTYQEQLRELNTASRDEAEWEVEGNRVIPKSLNVARLTRSKLKKTLTFNRIRIKSFNAPFKRNFAIYTLRSTSSKATLDQLYAGVANLQKGNVILGNEGNALNNSLAELTGRVQTLSTSTESVSSQGVRRCRICFLEGYGAISPSRCLGNRHSCAGYSDSGAVWTQHFIDNTDGGYSGCQYQWMVDCQK